MNDKMHNQIQDYIYFHIKHFSPSVVFFIDLETMRYGNKVCLAKTGTKLKQQNYEDINSQTRNVFHQTCFNILYTKSHYK